MRMGRWAMVATAAGAISLIGAGAFAAGTANGPGGSGTGPGAFLSDVASHLGVQPQALQSAIAQADIDRVNQMKAAGKITADQAQKMISEIQAGHVRWMEPGAHGPRSAMMVVGRQTVIQTAASYLGVPAQQITADLKAGKSLSQIANGVPGKSAAGLQAALQQAMQTKLSAAVTAGKLTSDQQQKIMTRMQTMLPKILARTWGGHAPAGSGTASGTSAQG